MKIRLTEEQSKAMCEWISDSDATLHIVDGHSGYGLYVSINDYPEDGAAFIAPLDRLPSKDIKDWLDNNTTFYDTAEQAAPVLASVSKRIWYHATDDQTAYPFSALLPK